jgi:uncharacterized protein (TIGR03435 family)
VAQPRPANTALAFEVASVKPAVNGPNGVAGGCHGIDTVYSPKQQAGAPPLGRCVITDARLSHLIAKAWGLNSMEMLEAKPDWIARGTERFNVEAKAEDPSRATEEQLLGMLQTLLAERFQLKFHREMRDMRGFVLAVAKDGPKLKASTNEESGVSFTGVDGQAILKPAREQAISMKARKMSIGALADLLGAIGGHGPGIDRTGLTGAYDFTLSWDDDAGPALSTALREQLGLRMEAGQVPVSYFVVDSAARPSAN